MSTKKSWYSLKVIFLFALFTSLLYIPPFHAPLPQTKAPSPAHLNARQTTPLLSKCPQQENLDKRAVISLHGSTSPITIIDYNVSGRTIVPQDSWEPCQCLSFTDINIFVLSWLQGLLKLLSSSSDVASHDSKSNFFVKSEPHCSVTIFNVINGWFEIEGCASMNYNMRRLAVPSPANLACEFQTHCRGGLYLK